MFAGCGTPEELTWLGLYPYNYGATLTIDIVIPGKQNLVVDQEQVLCQQC